MSNLDQRSSHDYSQFGEQAIILDFVERNPSIPHYVVDAGAFDGEIGSNSRALFLAGWAGVAIEPDPRSYKRLRSLYRRRKDVRTVRVALSDRTSLRRMRFCMGPPGTSKDDQWPYTQVNTFSKHMADANVATLGWQYETGWVFTTTLHYVLWIVRAPRDIGFMSIDCEGEDIAVLRALNLARWRPRLLCVESDDHSRSIYADYLQQHGYSFHAKTQSNTFFVAT